MSDEIIMSPSKKVGLNSKESYKVTRGSTVFLRVLGDVPDYELMTATASEDNKCYTVCNDLPRLVEAAMRTVLDFFDEKPHVETDFMGREYVKICVLEELNDKDLEPIVERFFDHFDNYHKLETRARDEIVDLYEALRIDDIDSDVYLSDGVWLSSDGSLHDRGR